MTEVDPLNNFIDYHSNHANKFLVRKCSGRLDVFYNAVNLFPFNEDPALNHSNPREKIKRAMEKTSEM